MSDKITGFVHSTESFGAVDGPGLRFIVFLQGCKMRCRYCHNPETWKIISRAENGELQNTEGVEFEERTPEDVLKQALRYKPYWKNGGGITVSGGEALLQMDFVKELFKLAKKEGINTALDTSGNPFTTEEPFFSSFKELCEYTDLFLLDIKEIDEEKHKSLTGFSNKNILELSRFLSENGKHMWIRYVLVPGVTDDEEDVKKLSEHIKTLKTVDKVEVLPYHTLGVPAYEKLGIKYTLEGVSAPTPEIVERTKKLLEI